jgi:hypothetical protein
MLTAIFFVISIIFFLSTLYLWEQKKKLETDYDRLEENFMARVTGTYTDEDFDIRDLKAEELRETRKDREKNK